MLVTGSAFFLWPSSVRQGMLEVIFQVEDRLSCSWSRLQLKINGMYSTESYKIEEKNTATLQTQ